MKKRLEMFNRVSITKRRSRAKIENPRGYRASFDVLERRSLLAVVNWIAATGGDWNVGSNWSTGQVPGPNDTAVIDLSGSPTISIGAQGADVGSIQSTDPISVDSSILTVSGSSSLKGGLSLNGSTLTVSGAGVAFNVTGTTTVLDSSIEANSGAQISMPGLADLNFDSANATSLFQATGSGSQIDLPNLVSLSSIVGEWNVEASNGGVINLPDLTSAGTIENPAGVPIDFVASGSNSVINISSLTSIDSTSPTPGNSSNVAGELSVTNGGSLLDPNLTTIAGVVVNLDGTGTISTNSWTSLTFDQIDLSGGVYNLGSVNNVVGSSFTITSGASLTLPSVESVGYQFGVLSNYIASGAGSVLSLPELKSFTGYLPYVNAAQGGSVLLPSLASGDIEPSGFFSANPNPPTPVGFVADGSNSLIELSSLSSIGNAASASGSNTIPNAIEVSNGAVVDAPALKQVSYVSVTLNAGTLDAAALTYLTASDLLIQGGTYNINSINNIDDSTIDVSGGASLTLSGVTTLATFGIVTDTLQASGAGSTLDLPNLSSLGDLQLNLQIGASGGGVIDLPALQAIDISSEPSSQIQINATGSGSAVNFSGLTSLIGVESVYQGSQIGSVSLAVGSGATISAPEITTISGATISIDSGTLAANALMTATNDAISVQNGTYTWVLVNDIGGSSLNATSGGVLNLPGVTGYSNPEPVDTAFEASGSGSAINLPALSSFGILGTKSDYNGSILPTFQLIANSGGEVLLPSLQSINTSNQPNVFFNISVNGSNSLIDLSSATSIVSNPKPTSLNGYPFSNQNSASEITISAGGTIEASNLTTMIGLFIELDDANFSAPSLSEISQSTLKIDSGSYTLNSLVDLDGSSVYAFGGSSLNFPMLKSYSNPSSYTTTINAYGSGSSIDMPALSSIGAINSYVSIGSSGGAINLPNLQTINLVSVNSAPLVFFADGSNSVVNLPSLTDFSSASLSSASPPEIEQYKRESAFTISNGGSIVAPELTNLSGVTAIFSGSVVFDVNQIKSFVNGAFYVYSGIYNFSSLSNIDGSTLDAEQGAVLNFPEVRQYTNATPYFNYFGSVGSGSVLNLPDLTRFVELQSNFGINAYQGGETLLPELNSMNESTTQNGSSVSIVADLAESMINLSSLTNLSVVNALDEIQFTNGGVVIDPNLTTLLNVNLITDPTTTLTIPAGQSITYSLAGAQITAGSVEDLGSLNVLNGGSVVVDGNLAVDSTGSLAIAPGGSLTIGGDLVGSTQNPLAFTPQGTVVLGGAIASGSNQLLEAMSADQGPVISGFVNNFAYGTLRLATGSSVVLVDQSVNSNTGRPEAVYANELIVPANSTLNLNGLHLYVRGDQIAGTVVGGTITVVPTINGITPGIPAFGSIANAGAIDAWTFTGTAGESIAAALNPGPGGPIPAFPPRLEYGRIELLGPNGDVLATASSVTAGAIALIDGTRLPSNGTYTIEVQASANQPASTGNYVLSVDNVTPSLANLTVNTPESGTIANPYAVNEWLFSGTAGERVQLQVLYTSTSNISFNLNGPDGYLAFANLQFGSGVITLPVNGTYVITVLGDGVDGGSYTFDLGASLPAAPRVVGIAATRSAVSQARTARISEFEQRYEARIERLDAYRRYLATLRQERIDRFELFHHLAPNGLNRPAALGAGRSPYVIVNQRYKSANVKAFVGYRSEFSAPRFGADHPVFFGELARNKNKSIGGR
jgi:hypothetical protein